MILFIRARGRRAAKGVESAAAKAKREGEIVVAKTMAAEKTNPYAPKRDLVDDLVPMIETITHLGEDPVMREKINAGSDRYFEAGEQRSLERNDD